MPILGAPNIPGEPEPTGLAAVREAFSQFRDPSSAGPGDPWVDPSRFIVTTEAPDTDGSSRYTELGAPASSAVLLPGGLPSKKPGLFRSER